MYLALLTTSAYHVKAGLNLGKLLLVLAPLPTLKHEGLRS